MDMTPLYTKLRNAFRTRQEKDDEAVLQEIADANLDTLSRVDAARELDAWDKRRREREVTVAESPDAVQEAQAWLETHPHTHSARRGDVRRLIKAVQDMDMLLSTTTTRDTLHGIPSETTP